MHQQLLEVLEPALLGVCRSTLEKHPGEQFYCVALYTSGEYSYLIDSVSTVEGLERVAQEYLEDSGYREEWGSLEVAMRELKWSPCDSPHHGEFAESFSRVAEVLDAIWSACDDDSDEAYRNTCIEVHETCLAALTTARNSGLFDKDRVVFTLLMGDQSDEERWLNAESLNSGPALEQLRSELEIDEEELRRLRDNRWEI